MQRFNRFFHQGDFVVGQTVLLNKEVSGHIQRVLRLKIEQQIQLFNGDGINYQATITDDGKTVSVVIDSKQAAENESNLEIHLGQAISRNERMDYTLQKSVELGVHEITPLITERVQFRFDEKRLAKKMQHWQKIIASACEQSGRAYLPKLNNPLNLEQWIAEVQNKTLLLVPTAKNGLMDVELKQQKGKGSKLGLLVGPEGGLSDKEVADVLLNEKFEGIKLGPRILRTETAALTSISILQARFGDL
jgi:16S rRNA (uracil1498-N3)-methyltransferase